MPRYSFKCTECKKNYIVVRKVKNFKPKETTPCIYCAGTGAYVLPTSLESESYQVNRFRGSSKKVGVEKQIKQRMKKNMAKYEYKDIIDKHGVDKATKDMMKKVKKV